MRTQSALIVLFELTFALPHIAAQGGTSGIVISQVYGGGGNSGATLRNDFIELFNRGNTAVSITGWSVQYASGTGSSWDRTLLSGVIQPGQYYLVQEAQGSNGTTSLPAPDLSGSINLSATEGKIALVSSSTLLSGTAPSGSQIVDLVGYGGANDSEGSPAAALTNTTAAIRQSGGCSDTNNNQSDFTVGSPSPRNSQSPVHFCSPRFSLSTPPSATPGIPFSFTVTALDANNNLFSGYPGTIHFSSTDSLANLPSNGSLPNGMGTFSATLSSLGNQFITSTDTVNSAITGTSNAIAVAGTAVFSISKIHNGNFMQGQNGAAYTITVGNSGTAATNGQVTVTESIPSGLTLISMSGQGWSCPANGTTCSRSDALNPSANYSTIIVAVNVSPTAAGSLTNQATVSGAGASAQTANDPTTIGSTAATCGVERWPVKTGTDPDAGLVSLNSLTSTTIANLVALTAPSPLPENNRVKPTETTVFGLNATLTQFKLEDDSDYHLVLSDSAGNTMIAEMPLPGCVGSTSPFLAGITNARSEFNARFTATTDFKPANIPVQVKGVGFFDFIHGQTGVAPNGIELHPVLDIAFNPASQPSVVSLAPAASNGASQMLTVTFNAPGGYQTLSVVDVLINDVLDGRRACYLAFVPAGASSGSLFLVDDAGDAGGPYQGIALPGSGAVTNSQCSVSGAGSSVSGSGSTLTLNLAFTFNSTFAGNKVVYAAAQDVSSNTGWKTMGVHGVPGISVTFPSPVGMSPSSGNTLNQTIAFTYQDQSSATNLQTVWALISTAIDGRGACYIAYYRPGNQVYLYPDNGDGTEATSIVLTGNNTIGNSQCTISALGSNVQTNGNTLTVSLPITFKTSFTGFKGVWLAAQTLGGAETSPWQALGAWNVPGS